MRLLWNIKKSHLFLPTYIYFGTVFLRQRMCVYERYMVRYRYICILYVCKFYIICMDILKECPILYFNLKESRLFDCSNSTGNKSHILWYKNNNDSVPWYTESTWRFLKASLLQSLYELDVPLRISGDKPGWILNISVTKTCMFFRVVCI